MKNVMQDSGATNAPIQTPEAARITGLQSLILELVNTSPYTTQEEKATAAQRVANCQNPATLAKWYRNAVIELGREDNQLA